MDIAGKAFSAATKAAVTDDSLRFYRKLEVGCSMSGITFVSPLPTLPSVKCFLQKQTKRTTKKSCSSGTVEIL